jgi:hypothetical protein
MVEAATARHLVDEADKFFFLRKGIEKVDPSGRAV